MYVLIKHYFKGDVVLGSNTSWLFQEQKLLKGNVVEVVKNKVQEF